ncbi:MAG: hypothetical protein JSU83_11030 [Deltaproteobacteria bacterium]|nr:MAG: hypothetical protein JSU83_11030 [Deltaproteobacteria bacterium]
MKIPERLQVWIDARKKYHLSHAHIQMARELGLNPRKFGKIANNRQEPWKAPLPVFIEDIYFKRFRKKRPDNIKSIEQILKDRLKSKEKRRIKKQLNKEKIEAKVKDHD